MTPALDIVIVTFNTRDEVLACLASIESARPDIAAHIIVVDNASADGTTKAIAECFPAVEVIPLERNVGFGAANNVGLRASSAPLALLLNSDTVVPKGAIDRLVARLEETGAVAAGPLLIDVEGRPEVSFGSMLSPFAELRQLFRGRLAASDRGIARRYIERLLSRERTVDWVSGACLLARRDAITDAGLFDERYFMYEEDVDLCAAMRARGGRILFTPASQIVHLRGRALRDAAHVRSAHYDRSHLAFYQKHAPLWVPLLKLWMRFSGSARAAGRRAQQGR